MSASELLPAHSRSPEGPRTGESDEQGNDDPEVGASPLRLLSYPEDVEKVPCQARIVTLVLEVTRPKPTNVPAIMLPSAGQPTDP